jgi:DNA-binding NarL/FixJ family response regulator
MFSVYGGTRFTERQRQVVRLIAAGCSNVEIAERLGVSPRTAKAHSDVLRSKLGVSRRRQIPAAYRDTTGEDPLEGLEATFGVRDDSRMSR